MALIFLLFVALATASPVKRQAVSMMDTDGDGTLSYAEVAAAMTLHEALFALDVDGDGLLYADQFIEIWGNNTKFDELDANMDGFLSFNEAENGMTLQEFYELVDANGDGALDATEAYHVNNLYTIISGNNVDSTLLDANGDGVLSKAEVLNMEYNEVVHLLDTNGDHYLSSDELMVLLGDKTADWIVAQDHNGDGQVSVGESHFNHMNMGVIFDMLDTDGSTYLEGDETLGVYTVWDQILLLNAGNTDPITG